MPPPHCSINWRSRPKRGASPIWRRRCHPAGHCRRRTRFSRASLRRKRPTAEPGKAGAVLVDSHCHLDFADFATDRDAIVARARDAGVKTMLTIGTRLDEFPGVRAIAE